MLKNFTAQIKGCKLNYLKSFFFFLSLYLLIVLALSGADNQKFEHLHLLLDTSNGILSLLLAVFLLAEQTNIQSNVRNYLAIGFAFAAATELLHAFVGIEWIGGFAWIGNYSSTLRPSTWPPSTYVLPLSLLWTIWLMRRESKLRPGIFAAGIALVTLLLYILAFNFPSYVDTGWLGIQRPTQIPLLLLLLLFVVSCWHYRCRSPLFEGLAWMGVFLFLSDFFMLFSASPHEKFTMMAHAGKLLAYMFLHVIQMRLAVDDSRARRQAEASLLLERDRLRLTKDELIFQQFALDQHSIVGITDVQGAITYVNSSFCKISGYSREELIGQNHRILNSGVHSTEFFREMYRTIAAGEVWHAEICNRAKDGHLYWVRTTIVPVMDEQGKPRQYISMRADISTRKRAEDELIRYKDNLEELVAEQTLDLKRAKEAAEAATHAKSEFLANMSHEIRTPMNGVVGIIDILQETSLDSAQKRLVNTIRTSSLALLTILGDILDFSKIEAGKLEIEILRVNLRELVEGVAQLMSPKVADKDMDLIIFISPDLPAWIYTDPGRLRQILFNLLGNAVKFTQNDASRRGEVILRVEKSVQADGQNMLNFSVIDNGIGMSTETMLQLFRPFSQADATTTRRFGGTGLGLSISKHLAELLHGKIEVLSTYGVGSKFNVILPLKLASAAHPPAVMTALTGMRVLIANEHHLYAEILSAYLHAVGVQIQMVASQEAALYVIQQTGQDGWDVFLDMSRDISIDSGSIRQIKNIAPLLPVVSLVTRRNSNASGNNLVVATNPLLFDELVHTLAIASKRHAIKDVIQKTERRSQSRKVAPGIEEAVASGELILVAEDNETSREVIQEQLRILGYASEAAEDGHGALDKWRTGRYSLLLTDCHMPHLDGFALTAAIREEEPEASHFPIIAVTGNAMHGEAQRCLSSGMDDYLAKPLRLSELGKKLSRWMPRQQAAEMVAPAQESVKNAGSSAVPAADTVWDASTLTRMVGDYPEMHRRLLDKFLQGAEEFVAIIIAAVAGGELETVINVAHKMKSAARTVGAMQLGELCQTLETAGRSGDTETVISEAAGLEAAFLDVSLQIRNSLVNK